MNILNPIKNVIKDKFGRVVLGPLNNLIDENISDISTTIGSFVIRSVRGKFQRSISFTVGMNYHDDWMEDALYGILYRYNNIKKSSRLVMSNSKTASKKRGAGLYYRLDSGSHNLKYRDYDILLVIQSISPSSPMGRVTKQTCYTIITYNLDPSFVLNFEKDMVLYRDSLLKIKSNSPTINVYTDYHDTDGFTYWEPAPDINKRKINTVYLPIETKQKIINTINNFLVSKDYYIKHGIAHNLKILLHGPAGSGKDSIAKMIASEWNRNIYYVNGGKNGKFIPNALCSNPVVYPLFIVSDIDKYPALINDTNVDLNDNNNKEEKVNNKQLFGNMINALDGIMSGEDRIIIMTTNHIEKFSPVFTRPGRIDLLLEIGYVTPNVFRKYIYDIYGKILPNDIKLKDNKLTMATLQFNAIFQKMSFNEIVDKYVKK